MGMRAGRVRAKIGWRGVLLRWACFSLRNPHWTTHVHSVLSLHIAQYRAMGAAIDTRAPTQLKKTRKRPPPEGPFLSFCDRIAAPLPVS